MKNFLVGLLVFLLALALMTATFSAGFVTGRTLTLPNWFPVALQPVLENSANLIRPPTSSLETGTPEELKQLFRPFWQAWDMVHAFYVDQPVNDELLMRGAIRGMMDSLGDPHTSYLDPAMFEATNAHLQGEEYEGIGAWVDITQDYLTIISPMPGSPAEKAGLRSGDKVIAIDGADMTGMDGEAVRQKVLGPKGSTVTLTILREGSSETFDVKVVRAPIVVPTVSGEILDGDIAYIQLYTFGDTTAKDLRSTLDKLLAQKPQGLILDLRNNGGGYLDTAIDIVSEFIDKGIVMYEVYGDGRTETFEAKPGGHATKIPMVVLINEGSASASEIVAGAIQDRGRGYLVGVTSFGKGSVQTYSELVDNQGAVRITIARWLTPDHRQIAGHGLNPDFPIEITEQDLADGIDSQLQKAIEVLTKNLTPPPTPLPSATIAPTATLAP
ncbi:MAG: S41 family peptidase [Anaerolineales bacterium]|nr:S41 family peptidase [Anaerolineales bacterium]